MKKFIIIGSILIISALSVTTYYFYQKHVAEREIDLYIADYGIPSKEVCLKSNYHFDVFLVKKRGNRQK